MADSSDLQQPGYNYNLQTIDYSDSENARNRREWNHQIGDALSYSPQFGEKSTMDNGILKIRKSYVQICQTNN